MDNNLQTISISPEPRKNGQSLSIYILIFSVLMMVLAALVLTKDLDKLKALIAQAGIWGIVISILIYALLGLTLIPSEPLTLFVGALFGPWIATLIAGTGNTLSAFVEYYLGTHIGSATNFKEKKDKLPFGIGKLKVKSPLFLVGARMIPGYGAKFVSMMAGIYRVPLLRYLWTTALPIFIGAIIFAFGGAEIGLLTKSK